MQLIRKKQHPETGLRPNECLRSIERVLVLDCLLQQHVFQNPTSAWYSNVASTLLTQVMILCAGLGWCSLASNAQPAVGSPTRKTAYVGLVEGRFACPTTQDLSTTPYLEACFLMRRVVLQTCRTEGASFGFGITREAQSTRPLCVRSACGTPSSEVHIAV